MPRTTPFDHVVAEHGATVWRVCRAVVGPDDVDDAWSETFLAGLRAWPALPDDADVEAWLVTVAHRKAIDVVRRRARQAVPVGDLPERAGAQGDPRVGELDLWAALARLTERQRLAVAYHHLAGLPHAQVAEVLGCSPAAARRASADGIAALRRLMPDLTDPEDAP